MWAGTDLDIDTVVVSSPRLIEIGALIICCEDDALDDAYATLSNDIDFSKSDCLPKYLKHILGLDLLLGVILYFSNCVSEIDSIFGTNRVL